MIHIKRATYSGDYKIDFEFSDGKTIPVDFYQFISLRCQNPSVSKYLDKNLFKNFKIINKRDISWNNYEMCFRFDEIYSGKIEPFILFSEIDQVCEPFSDYSK